MLKFMLHTAVQARTSSEEAHAAFYTGGAVGRSQALPLAASP